MLGWIVTCLVLRQLFYFVLTPMNVSQLLLNSSMSDGTFELCTESFLEAIAPLVSNDLLMEICLFDPVAFLERQTSYWSFPEIEQKVPVILIPYYFSICRYCF